MAQNLTIAGASYSDVPAVNIAKNGGGIATFTDVSDSTVTPETLAEGITAYNAAGEFITGTGSLGTVRYDTTQELTDEQKAQARTNIGAEGSPAIVDGTGSINFTCAENTDYVYTDVTSLAMTAAAVNCHGFIGFGSSTPTINVSGFAASNGDDITSAAAGEVWEFSVFGFNGGAYIIWQKKGE